MYLTAQRIRNHEGAEDVHAFLHLHNTNATALNDPFSVPLKNPGKLVMASSPILIAPGGNSVVSYLDLVVDDEIGIAAHPDSTGGPKPWWQDALESVARQLGGDPLPWTVAVLGVHVIFSAEPAQPPVTEYQQLLASTIALWTRWSTAAPASVALGAV